MDSVFLVDFFEGKMNKSNFKFLKSFFWPEALTFPLQPEHASLRELLHRVGGHRLAAQAPQEKSQLRRRRLSGSGRQAAAEAHQGEGHRTRAPVDGINHVVQVT